MDEKNNSPLSGARRQLERVVSGRAARSLCSPGCDDVPISLWSLVSAATSAAVADTGVAFRLCVLHAFARVLLRQLLRLLIGMCSGSLGALLSPIHHARASLLTLMIPLHWESDSTGAPAMRTHTRALAHKHTQKRKPAINSFSRGTTVNKDGERSPVVMHAHTRARTGERSARTHRRFLALNEKITSLFGNNKARSLRRSRTRRL